MKPVALVALFIGAAIGLYFPDIDRVFPFLLHRSGITHSVLIPFAVLWLTREQRPEWLRAVLIGVCLTLAVHLECCGACRHVVLRLEEVEGRLLASTPGVALQPDALQRALKQIDTPPAFSGHVKGIDAAVEECSLPRMISEIGLSPAVHLSADTWVAHLDAPRFGGWRTYVLCAPALAAVPAHGHFGDELIAVLEGSFHDSREFGPGDFVENRAGFVHEMQIASAGRLVALISSHGAIDWRPRDRALGALLDI